MCVNMHACRRRRILEDCRYDVVGVHNEATGRCCEAAVQRRAEGVGVLLRTSGYRGYRSAPIPRRPQL